MDPLDAIRVTGLQWFALGNGEKLRGYNHTEDPLGGVGREVPSTRRRRTSRRAAASARSRCSPASHRSRSATGSGWTPTSTAARTPTSRPSKVHPSSCSPLTPAATLPVLLSPRRRPTLRRVLLPHRQSSNPRLRPRTAPTWSSSAEGAGDVTFTGPNATNPASRASPGPTSTSPTQTSGRRDDRSNDSNPDPDTGEAPVDVGPPGHNDHTIDAGFNATGTFAITKLIDERRRPAAGSDVHLRRHRGHELPRRRTCWAASTRQSSPSRPVRPVPAGRPTRTSGRHDDHHRRADRRSVRAVTYDPVATQLITVNDNEPTVFTVTDRFYLPGEFTVEKLLDGDPTQSPLQPTSRSTSTGRPRTVACRAPSACRAERFPSRSSLPRNTVVNLTEAEPTNLPPASSGKVTSGSESKASPSPTTARPPPSPS